MAGGVALAGRLEEHIEVQGPWPLPKGWAWAKLGNLLSHLTSGSRDWAEYYDRGSKVFIMAQNVRSGRYNHSYTKYVDPPEHLKDVERSRVQRDDLLVTIVGANTGVVCRIDFDAKDYFVCQSVALMRPILPQLSAYLEMYLVAPDGGRGQMNKVIYGAGRPHLSFDQIESVAIPLPPPAEQRRIVARVDQLLAEITEGEAALATARKGLDAFRRALLKAAVTGELTKDWRTENPVCETGQDLLARIAKDNSGNGTSKGGTRRPADSKPLDISALPKLPDGWAWATIADIGKTQLGRQRAPQHHSGENMRPYLRVANVFEDRIDLADVKKMNFTPAEFKTFELKPGDILLNEGQTPDLLGRSAMWRGEFQGYCFQNTLLRFQAHPPLHAEFCLLVFRHYLHSKRFKKESQITTNIAHLSSGRFITIEFPVPPQEEQVEILRRVSEALAASADTLAVLDAEAADAERLKQSILKAAFEGRLCSQNPADEPANALLARMAANPAVATVRRGRARKSDA